MVSVDRQTIMETNRSLRNIKTELENLLEKGVIDEAVFDNIHAALPEESSLSGPLRRATSNGASPAPPTPAAAPSSPAQRAEANAPPPTKEFQGLGINATSPAPPSYEDTPPPNLPNRGAKPVIAQARALYRYVASDGRDLSFEKDDVISIYERMNKDWWMGQNQRTGLEGIFPCNYVFEEPDKRLVAAAAAAPLQPPYAYAQPQYSHQGPPPPQPNPYNASVPPMAVAGAGGGQQPPQGQQGGLESKMGGMGKKFGKKLGNAAIFGAGATIGGNIVNSIF